MFNNIKVYVKVYVLLCLIKLWRMGKGADEKNMAVLSGGVKRPIDVATIHLEWLIRSLKFY